MPLYDFECTACGHTLEALQNLRDPLLRKCPKCGKLKLKQVFKSAPAMRIQGQRMMHKVKTKK